MLWQISRATQRRRQVDNGKLLDERSYRKRVKQKQTHAKNKKRNQVKRCVDSANPQINKANIQKPNASAPQSTLHCGLCHTDSTFHGTSAAN